jgi:hypothetical protein
MLGVNHCDVERKKMHALIQFMDIVLLLGAA